MRPLDAAISSAETDMLNTLFLPPGKCCIVSRPRLGGMNSGGINYSGVPRCVECKSAKSTSSESRGEYSHSCFLIHTVLGFWVRPGMFRKLPRILNIINYFTASLEPSQAARKGESHFNYVPFEAHKLLGENKLSLLLFLLLVPS